MKKWLLLLTIVGLICWLPGQALATGAVDTYDSTLDTLKLHDPGFPVSTDYGTVTVYWFNPTTANVAFHLADTPNVVFFNNNFSAFLNVAGTAAYTATTGAVNWSESLVPVITGNAGLGTFDVAAATSTAGLKDVLFALTATGGTTWADAASVLECNATGFDAGAFLKYPAVVNPTITNGTNGAAYLRGYVGESCPVPLPGAVLLLGAGLARLAAYSQKKRQV